MTRRCTIWTVGILGLVVACATPVPDSGATSSGVTSSGGSGGSGGQEGVGVGSEPPPTSCPASRIRELRYGSTVGRQVDLPASIASRRCVDRGDAALAEDIACAHAFNRGGWDQAMAAQGLTPFEPEYAQVWLEQGLQPGAVLPHPEDPGRELVVLNYDYDDGCSGATLHTQPSPGISLARDRAGEIVIVVPQPEIEARTYPTCSCFPGCGAMQEPQPPALALIPEGARVAGTVELVYPGIAITTTAVDTQSCCCAP